METFDEIKNGTWERTARKLEEEKQDLKNLLYKYMAFVNSFHGETGTQRLNLTNEYLVYHRIESRAKETFKFSKSEIDTLVAMDNDMIVWDTENTY